MDSLLCGNFFIPKNDFSTIFAMENCQTFDDNNIGNYKLGFEEIEWHVLIIFEKPYDYIG